MRALLVSVPAPHEIVVSGRLARLPELIAALAVVARATSPRWSRSFRAGRARPRAAARCWPMALAGGPNAALAEALRLRESSGTALDYLRVAGAETISLG